MSAIEPPDEVWLLKAAMESAGIEHFNLPAKLRPYAVRYVRSRTCQWEQAGQQNYWASECGELWAHPKEDAMRFCPFCGGSITVS